jgi:hypothetical protein
MFRLITICLLTTGCATQVAPEAREVRTVYLICAKTVPLDINHDGRTAVVRNWQGRQVTLKRDEAFPGVKYSGSNVTVMRTDDVYVFISSDGKVHDCERLKR